MILFVLRTLLKFAAGPGLEPRYYPPEGYVLPLDDPAMSLFCPKFGSKSRKW